MVRETRVASADLIYPIFVTHEPDVARPIESMPGIHQLSINRAVDEAGEAAGLGLPAVLLFGIPGSKDAFGTLPIAPEGFSR